MKRLIALVLCLLLVLPLAFVLPLSAATTEAINNTGEISVGKRTYYPGETIGVTAPAGGDKDWVGIVPASEDGEPVVLYGAIYWKYIGEGLVNSPITECDGAINENNGNNLAEQVGVTRDQLMDLAAGQYFMARVPDDMKMKDAHAQGLVTFVPLAVNYFETDKTAYNYGESIMVTPLGGSGADWIGISPVGNDGSVSRSTRYIYIDPAQKGAGVGVSVDIRNNGIVNGDKAAPIAHLPAGRYVIYFVAKDGAFSGRDVCSEVYVTVNGLSVEKTEFAYGEPIMVTPYGDGLDWVGLAKYDPETGSIIGGSTLCWRYIVANNSEEGRTGCGSGVAVDIREAKFTGYATDSGITEIGVGDYVLVLGANNCNAPEVSTATYLPIIVSGEAPAQPTSVFYDLTDASTGLAGGTVTVTFAEADMEIGRKPAKVELYWADENGVALADYNAIGSRKITGITTRIEMPASLVIPTEAKALMVRACNGVGSAVAVAAALPANRTYSETGAKLASFQVVSDMHIGRGGESADHATKLFADVLANDPDSVGIFVAGDSADHGQSAEYEELLALWEASGLVGKLYLGVGNHEMMKDTSSHNYSSSYTVQIERFLEYANKSLEEAEKTDTPYYYVNRGGQHFIFLATEYCGTHAYLSDAQLAWLSAKLEEVAFDGTPVFIMLHQGLYDTVAGTLVGQGWNGVIAGDANFAAWQQLTAENGKGLSDHSLMKDQYEAPLREILAQYPSAMMFSGHSHWILESLGNVYEATEAQPNYFFNTASVSYLWTDFDERNGGTGTAEGSQGYFVTVYENCVEIRGRDILNGTWVSNAYYRVQVECRHAYDNGCDATCNYCGETRTVGGHIYDNETCDPDCNECRATRDVTHAYANVCDATCDVCGEPREVADHVYDDVCDADCNNCGAVRVPDHLYETVCDTACNGCGATREVPHVYENACDKECGVCGATRETEDHVYTNTCDTDCNECGATRAVTHTYDNACDTDCGVCGLTRTVGDHVYADGCDTDCNECGAIRTVPHAYDNACDTTCNSCGETRTVGGHIYDDETCDANCNECDERRDVTHAYANACDTDCDGCGLTRTVEGHVYGNDVCDADCDECGAVRVPSHLFESDCDTACDSCGATREVTHTYENDCDTACDMCGAVRETMGHVYTDACDADCNECGETRNVPHVYENSCDKECNECGATRETTHVYAHACDLVCGECGEVRDMAGEHTYDDDCDTDCNACGAVRAVTHAYDNACDADCNTCGATRTPEAHVYSSDTCDADCDVCGAVRVPLHDYENACDTICGLCGETRTVGSHVYDNETCDAHCNECGAGRVVPHSYDSTCDVVCNECGLERSIVHTYDHACDTVCNVCGDTRMIEHRYSNACDAECNECGKTRTAEDHVWNSGVVTLQPTTEAEGTKTFTCTVCKETKTEQIEKLPPEEQKGTAGDNNTAQNGAQSETEKDGVGIGAIIGIVVGAVALVGGGVAVAVILRKKKKA